jgi:hypothetical protein
MKPFIDRNRRLAVAVALFLGSTVVADETPQFTREYLRDRRSKQAEENMSARSRDDMTPNVLPTADESSSSFATETASSGSSALLPRRMVETTSTATPKCQSYIDQFPAKTSCISSEIDFESYLQDETVFAMLLCDGFTYSPTKEMSLYNQYKTVVCEGVCKIDGSKVDEATQSAFAVSNNTSLDFCGVDFENFFFGVSLYIMLL